MSSRESDNAYPTPRRTGPDAYPSGTPPYGTPGLPGGADRAGSGQSDTAGSAPAEGGGDAPKTETTLTTRVRINIPGSRPIPPVVVRSAVKNEDAPEAGPAEATEPPGPRHRSAAPSSPVLGVMDGSARTATPPNLPPEWQTGEPAGQSEAESTGEWFRPRQKKGAADPAPAPVTAGAPAAAPGRPAEPRGTEPGRPAGARPDAARPGAPRSESGRPGSNRPDAGRKEQGRPNGQRPTPGPAPTGAPASPFAGTGRPDGAANPFDEGMPADPFAADPFATDPFGADPYPGGPAAPGTADRFGQGAADPLPSRPHPQGNGRPQGGPAGRGAQEDTAIGGFEPIRDDAPPAAIPGLPQSGLPRSGPYAPAPGGTGADPFATSPQGAGADPFATAAPGGRFPGGPAGAPDPFAPASPGRPSDQGAAFGSEQPFPPGAPYGNGAGRPGPGSPAGAPAGGRPAPAAPAGEQPADKAADKPAPKAAPAKRRGKASKLVVYGIGFLLFAGAAAYGTGLMLNQADVPKGTVVLGTDIGGSSRDQAIHQLEDTVGKAGQQPVKLKIGEQTLDLDPTAAGLSFDTTGTVDGLTQHSYSPVDVINSLKGGEKAVPPLVKVDRAKLKAALDALAASSGQGLQEGYVKFTEAGEVVVVPGKAGQAVDSTAAVEQVEQAYRDRAAGKPETPINLPVAAAQPKVSPQALQAAADSLGKSVLNGLVHVTAGTKKFDFGKATAAKALTLAPDASGNIVPKWDYDQLGGAIGGIFDKLKARKAGALAPITAQDVADGITSVLDKTGDKDRTFKFTTT
ncbi:peptidoglycan binding domain-containing protein [Kitasatospora indigofera]|uniref:peptidoglycan binding domain-containing protein n=2 Tax=Kitasatospora indigofera TaxID=67307 RepID=UPI003693C6B2